MTNYNTLLQTAAAIGSAVAAIFAYRVARDTLIFQKNSLLRKASIEQMLKLLQQLYYLKSLTDLTALGMADEHFVGMEQQISEIRLCVKALESMISTPASADLKEIRDFAHSLREDNVFAPSNDIPNSAFSHQLAGAINAVQKIYHSEIKST